MRRILLIDDDDAFTTNTRIMFEESAAHKYKVTIAKTLEEAWKAINTQKEFNLFLIDLELIKGTFLPQGLDLAESLKKDERTKDIPIIFITDVFDNISDKRLSRLGCGLIKKPTDIERIFDEIDEILRTNPTK
ncbi:MAG: PleD family two-component system response regulator [Candidatus Thorarchaeota archaeon]